jgi:hypothetical protein
VKRTILATLLVLLGLGLAISTANAEHGRRFDHGTRWQPTLKHGHPGPGVQFHFGVRPLPLRRHHRRALPPYGHRHHAYPPPQRWGLLTGRAIANRLLRHHGFRIHNMRLHRGAYYARARGRYGQPMLLIIDPYSGRILERQHLR